MENCNQNQPDSKAYLPQNEIELILDEYHKRQVLEHMTGPIVSLFVHVVIFSIIFLFMGENVKTVEAPGIDVDLVIMKVKTLDPIIEKKIILENIDEIVPTVDKPELTEELKNNESGVSGTIGEINPDDMASTDNGIDVDSVLEIKFNSTPLKMPGLYDGRTEAGRKGSLFTNGGTLKTEASVIRSLKWLKDHQNEDGSWSQSQPVAMCGLALLTYLSHNETPSSKEYGITVQKAMQYLSNKVMETTQLGDYAQGIVAYALSESYGMTGIPSIKPAAEKAIQLILDRQCDHGGWYYGLVKGEKWDMSVSGWQIQAVKAAYVAGLENKGLIESIEKSIQFLKKEAYSGGRFGYQVAGVGSPAMTGAGTLCLQILGEEKSKEAISGSKWISENVKVEWKDNNGHLGSYGWYYETQAMFHAGVGFWTKWNDMFSKELIKNQKSDGHWESANGKGYGEFDPYMQTTLCCLMLQVYYRYLPTYKLNLKSIAVNKTLDMNDTDGLMIK